MLENTNVTCTCKAASVGQPAGYLAWVAGKETSQQGSITKRQQLSTPNELHYSQSFTLSDHGKAWVRCDIIWGQYAIPGQNYTASVGRK